MEERGFRLAALDVSSSGLTGCENLQKTDICHKVTHVRRRGRRP